MLDTGPPPRPRAAAPPGMLPMRARGLTLRAGGRTLLDGIDLTLGPHGTTMVLGPNGAGKSLLLRLLHGLIPATGGEVLWGGERVGEATRRRQSMVFQTPVLLRRSVGANLDFVLRARRLGGRARRDALLDHVGLLGRADQPARLLSGGERQRLALARALATEPEVLLLDEPTASLDPASVLAIEEIVGAARDGGTRIVFVTHDVGQARRLADDVVFLHRGRLAEHGPARRFLAGPDSPAARDYLAGRIVV